MDVRKPIEAERKRAMRLENLREDTANYRETISKKNILQELQSRDVN